MRVRRNPWFERCQPGPLSVMKRGPTELWCIASQAPAIIDSDFQVGIMRSISRDGKYATNRRLCARCVSEL